MLEERKNIMSKASLHNGRRRLANTAMAGVLALTLGLGGLAIPTTDAWAADLSLGTGAVAGANYKVYQILTGEVNGNQLGNAKLNATYAQAVVDTVNSYFELTGTADEIKYDSNNNDFSTANKVMDQIATLANNSTKARTFANELANALNSLGETATATSTTPAENLVSGYYLVMSDPSSQAFAGDGQAMTTAVLTLVGNADVTVILKSSTPTVEKQVDDDGAFVNAGDTTVIRNNDGTYTLGDIDYKLTGFMPDNIAEFDTYKFTFTDTLPTGMTITEAYVNAMTWSATAKLNGDEVNLQNNSDADLKFSASLSGTNKIVWTITDLKKALEAAFPSGDISDATVEIDYTLSFDATNTARW